MTSVSPRELFSPARRLWRKLQGKVRSGVQDRWGFVEWTGRRVGLAELLTQAHHRSEMHSTGRRVLLKSRVTWRTLMSAIVSFWLLPHGAPKLEI